MQVISTKNGDKEYLKSKRDISKIFLEYLNQYDENMTLNEDTIYYFLEEVN